MKDFIAIMEQRLKTLREHRAKLAEYGPASAAQAGLDIQIRECDANLAFAKSYRERNE